MESLPESLSMTLFDTFETYREILVAQVEEDRELANRLQKPFVSFEQNLTALRQVNLFGADSTSYLIYSRRLYMTNIRKKVQQMQSKQKQWSQQEDQRQLHLRRKDEVATKLSNMQEHSASNLAQLTTLVRSCLLQMKICFMINKSLTTPFVFMDIKREEEQTFRAAGNMRLVHRNVADTIVTISLSSSKGDRKAPSVGGQERTVAWP